jgi:hypothetical protein
VSRSTSWSVFQTVAKTWATTWETASQIVVGLPVPHPRLVLHGAASALELFGATTLRLVSHTTGLKLRGATALRLLNSKTALHLEDE